MHLERIRWPEGFIVMTTEKSPASMAEKSPTPVMVFDWVLGRDLRRGRGERKEPVGRLEFPPPSEKLNKIGEPIC
jgi:hypothetical protein